MVLSLLNNCTVALTGVAQWVGHCPAKRRVICWLPSQGTCLSCGFGPWSGAFKRQLSNFCLAHHSLFFSFPSPLSQKIS